MKMLKLRLKLKEEGFTLIELMIVVGIIGILVSIAAPNFSRYQSKARQSEAKIGLAAIYGGEKSFYSEYSAYVSSMEAIGYSPEGQRRFYAIGWAGVHGSAITGYSGGNTIANYVELANPYSGCGTAPGLASALTGDSQTFVVSARGCIRHNQGAHDQWNINENKIMVNNAIAL
jgi:prepilin-type N-terminal cleavage/methylation domain-containing protein